MRTIHLQPSFTLYTKPDCPYCDKAKALLYPLNIIIAEFDCADEENKSHLKSMGHKTVPQVWFNDDYIGGCDALEKWLEKHKGMFA